MKNTNKAKKCKSSAFQKDDAYKALEMTNTWIGNIDSKSSFGLALIGVFLGFTFKNDFPKAFANIAEKSNISELCCCDIIAATIVSFLYITSFLSLISLMLAIMARVKEPSNSNSIFYFGAISKTDLKTYKKMLRKTSECSILNDLETQIHTNSNICMQKIKFYNFGMKSLFVSIVLWFICMIFKLI